MTGINITSQGNIHIGGDVVGGDKITYEAAPPLALSLHQIPPPPPDFVGRQQELKDLLAHFEQGATLVGVRGQGGIGKTALALKLAEILAPRFPDAQFYVDLRGASDTPLTPADAMAHVIRAYHPTARLPEAEADLHALYFSVLAGQRALLLLDDAHSRAQVAPLVPPTTCGLLIASRHHFALPGLLAQDLDLLPPADAVALLAQIVGAQTPPLHEIARLCGYLPLALRAAGSLLAEMPDLVPDVYARQLEDERARLALTGLKAEGSEISVAASFTLSYDRLTPAAQAVFAALAVFPGSFDAPAAEAVCQDPGHPHLSDLVRRSLVSFLPPSPVGDFPNGAQARAGGEGRYHLHALARLYADTRLSPDARVSARQRHALYYQDVLTRAEDLYLEGHAALKQGLALFDLEWPKLPGRPGPRRRLLPQMRPRRSAICLPGKAPSSGCACTRARTSAGKKPVWPPPAA